MSSIFARSILVIFIVFSFIFSQSIHTSFAADGTSSTCADTNITGLSASASNQIFIPKNVIDNNFNTLWSNYGKGSWIQLDLGTSKNICSVNIAWYKGDVRQNNFVISTSTDGSSFKNVLATKSIGNTLSYEKYSIPNTLARYVKITVNGNTQNNYASITEVKVQTSSLGESQNQCTTNLAISGVTASGNDGNVPSNVVDNNLNTRWSNLGIGSWIRADLGSSKNICSVDIAWYKGNERQNNFVIATSTDGTTFTNVFTGKSSGTTLNSEKYVIPATDARYVRVTVNGNTANTWASITELDIFGSSPSSNSPPVANNQGVTTNKNTAKGIILTATDLDNDLLTYSIVTPPSHGTLTGTAPNLNYNPAANYVGPDSFAFKANDGKANSNTASVSITVQDSGTGGGDGVKTIYPTLSGGETWFFNPVNPDDGQFDRNGAEISKNTDGSWHLKPGTTRMLAFTKSSGFPSDEVRSSLPTYDYSRLPQIGYFYKPTDWKNVEITIYVKVLSASGGGDEISLVSRSVRHSTNVHEGCGGSSYHNNIDFTNGKFKYKKEMWHVNYDIKPYSGITIGSTMNKWIGFKGIVYNLPDGSVKLESYVDKDNNNNWQKATELVDKGNWGNDMTHCNARTDGAAITWGSPMIIFKSNGVTYDFKKFSVRQIVPPV